MRKALIILLLILPWLSWGQMEAIYYWAESQRGEVEPPPAGGSEPVGAPIYVNFGGTDQCAAFAWMNNANGSSNFNSTRLVNGVDSLGENLGIGIELTQHTGEGNGGGYSNGPTDQITPAPYCAWTSGWRSATDDTLKFYYTGLAASTEYRLWLTGTGFVSNANEVTYVVEGVTHNFVGAEENLSDYDTVTTTSRADGTLHIWMYRGDSQAAIMPWMRLQRYGSAVEGLEVSITSPSEGDIYVVDDTVDFSCTVSYAGTIDSVVFSNAVDATFVTGPYEYQQIMSTVGNYIMKATAYTPEGSVFSSVSFQVNSQFTPIHYEGATSVKENTPVQYVGRFTGGTEPYYLDELEADNHFFMVLNGDSLYTKMMLDKEMWYNSNYPSKDPTVRVTDSLGFNFNQDIVVLDNSDIPDGNYYATQLEVDYFESWGDSTLSVGDFLYMTPDNNSLHGFGQMPVVSWPNQIKIAGYYQFLSIKMDSARGINTQKPVIVTNFGGQAMIAENVVFGGAPYAMRFTGQYDPVKKTGNKYFSASIHDEFKHGWFGVYRSAVTNTNAWAISFTGQGASKMEFDHIETMGPSYTGFNLKDDFAGGGIVDSLHVHHNYVHDPDGEGFYQGNTKSVDKKGIQQFFTNSRTNNNLALRTPGEAIQTNRNLYNNEVAHNILWGGGAVTNSFQFNQYSDEQISAGGAAYHSHHNIAFGGGEHCAIALPRSEYHDLQAGVYIDSAESGSIIEPWLKLNEETILSQSGDEVRIEKDNLPFVEGDRITFTLEGALVVNAFITGIEALNADDAQSDTTILTFDKDIPTSNKALSMENYLKGYEYVEYYEGLVTALNSGTQVAITALDTATGQATFSGSDVDIDLRVYYAEGLELWLPHIDEPNVVENNFYGQRGASYMIYANGREAPPIFPEHKFRNIYAAFGGTDFGRFNINHPPDSGNFTVFFEENMNETYDAKWSFDSIFYDNTFTGPTRNEAVGYSEKTNLPWPEFENPWGAYGDSIRTDRFFIWTDTIYKNTSYSGKSNGDPYTGAYKMDTVMEYRKNEVVRNRMRISFHFAGEDAVYNLLFVCKVTHKANVDNEPGVGPNWQDKWELMKWWDPHHKRWTYYPPDDYDLVEGSFYDSLGMGLERPEVVPADTTVAECSTFPGGRIAMVSDGNASDADDHGSMAFALAMIHYADLKDKLVFLGYNCLYKSGCTQANGDWCDLQDTSVYGSFSRWGYPTEDIIFNYLDEYTANGNSITGTAGIAALAEAINASSAGDTLWLYAGGPMDVIHRSLELADAGKRGYVNIISHSSFNETSVMNGLSYNLADIQTDFPEVNVYLIADQNTSNGNYDFRDESSSPIGEKWLWLTEEGAPANWTWLRERNLDAWLDDFDISDAGMMYWLISGGSQSGCENCGTAEVEALFNDGCN